MFNTQNKSGISAPPCVNLYLYRQAFIQKSNANFTFYIRNVLLQKLCYTQNLVKNSWLMLRRDFLSDINKNLNILAEIRLYFTI
jgi:hypothetical protein